MKKNSVNPKLKINSSSVDYMLETSGLLCLLALFILPVYYYSGLPDSIPRHFNFAGQADAWGNKQAIFTLPAVGAGLYLLLSIISRFPHTFNYMAEITVDNAENQYTIALRMVRMLKLILMIAFLYITAGTINTALRKADGLGAAFLPVLLLTIGAVIAGSIIKSKKNEKL